MNVSGHRVSTMEVESALVDHKSVAEAAVIGKPHEIKGQAIAAFVTLKTGVDGTPALMDELKQHVAKKIGAIARPDDIIFSAELPKTRSGKIMRRLLRDIAEGRALGRHDHAGRSGRRLRSQEAVRGGIGRHAARLSVADQPRGAGCPAPGAPPPCSLTPTSARPTL